MKSVLVNARKGRYEFNESGDLWRLLTSIAIHKLRHKKRIHTAGKRAVTGEDSASGSVNGVPIEAIQREPTPDELVELSEQFELALAELTPPQRIIIDLTLEGYSVEQIMERVGRTQRTVQRVLESFRRNLEGQFRTLSSV